MWTFFARFYASTPSFLLRRCFLLLVLVAAGSAPGFPASPNRDGICGTYPGRVLTELALHQQFVNQRVRQGFLPLAVSSVAPVDVGNIAVLPDDGTLVMPANLFDLDARTLTFVPATGWFSVQAGSLAFDNEAAAAGVLLNPSPASNPANIGDDGTRQVALGFAFPFFGKPYTSVFINSDGNLTFLEGDTATSPRSQSRFLTGAPRIAPYFADLDPSAGGQLTYFSSSSQLVVTWSAVPDFSDSGVGPRETFQVALRPDGRIQFSYSGINGKEAVVGVSPGSFTGPPNLIDLSAATGSTGPAGPLGEVFTASTQLDLPAVAQSFYKTHEDAYDFLVLFTNFDFDLGGAFAFEVNIANQVTGIGPVFNPPVFDFSSFFGSSRLQSLVNMGNLSRYPANPATVFLRGVDSTLSILGQESGHRFLTYVTFNDLQDNSQSTALLGRDLQHWNFFFNSDASVMEGNRIRENGDGTFTTTGVVEHYNEMDQYLMGLRAPSEVGGSFLVKDPSIPFPASRSPQLNVNFSGRRADVALGQIIDANGPRLPNSVIAPKSFTFAFVLVVPRGSSASAERVAQLDTIRREWEPFFAKATSSRGAANTALVRGLQFTPSPLGLFAGAQGQARLELLAAAATDVAVSLTNSNPAALALPSRVMIPSGSKSATFAVTALNPGRALVSAEAAGFESSAAVIEVLPSSSAAGLSLSVTDGNLQVGSPRSALPRPLQVSLRDGNQIPFAGARIEFAITESDAVLSPAGAFTDGQGNASTGVTLGAATGPVTVIATVLGASLSARFSLFSLGTVQVPPAGIVNGASFAPGPVSLSPGSILSIFGTNLSATTAAASSLPLPTRLANTTVEIGGIAAPLFFVSPLQINAQVPAELSGSTASLVVRNGVSSSAPIPLALRAASPGLFSQDSSGRGPGAITHSVGQLPVTVDSPASAGEVVQIFATGLGSVSPTVPSGRPAPSQPLSRIVSSVTVTLNGVPAPVLFAGLAPGFAGLYQVNLQVPAGIRGTVEVVLTLEGVSSNAVTMEVR